MLSFMEYEVKKGNNVLLWSVPSYEMLQTTHFTNKEINKETNDMGI